MQLLDADTKSINGDDKILLNNAILRKISCLAQENNIYIAINLVTLEVDGLNKDFYNDKSLNLDENLKSSGSNNELDTLKMIQKIN